jgi:hypothetical protein
MLLTAPLVSVMAGCTNSDELPTVPPPPPPGTIKQAPAQVLTLPESVREKLLKKKAQDAARESDTAKTKPADGGKGDGAKSEPQKGAP